MADVEQAPLSPTPLPTPKATAYGVEEAQIASTGSWDRERVEVAMDRLKVAVFVAHGMGQQIPFQTLDDVAQGLRKQDPRWSQASSSNEECAPDSKTPRAKAVAIKMPGRDQWLHRLELCLQKKGESVKHEVHVYESYWAPLTEGKITLRNVMSFLLGAGLNGIRNGSHQYCRWLFGDLRRFDSPLRIILFLLATLAVVVSLVAMNTTIVLVAAARAPLADPPAWLSPELFADLSTTFQGVLLAIFPFGLALWLSATVQGPRLRKVLGVFSLITFTLTIFVIVLAGAALPLLFYRHVPKKDPSQIWPQILGSRFFGGLEVAWSVAVAAVALGVLLWLVFRIAKLGKGAFHKLFGSNQRQSQRSRLLDGVTVTLFLLLAGSVAALAWALFSQRPPASNFVLQGLAWPLLVGVSAFVRKFLIQYLGDVAIYVTPYKLDGFYQLREEIRQCNYDVARAVYEQKEYDRVFVVGHSLGSVIVYDTLNQLINEDIAAAASGQGSLDVAARTPLLLTFGSPLDKTAFLFGTQTATEAREALAATKQPLIQAYRYRPQQWVNLWSTWDIISGSLDFYDPPCCEHDELIQDDDNLLRNAKRIENVKDLEATTLLAAHTQYWKGNQLFKTLYEAIVT
jgi:hypothetical protein